MANREFEDAKLEHLRLLAGGREKPAETLPEQAPRLVSGGLPSHTTGERIPLGPDRPERLSSSEVYRRMVESMDAAAAPVDFNRF
jgi:hypothetical protein